MTRLLVPLRTTLLRHTAALPLPLRRPRLPTTTTTTASSSSSSFSSQRAFTNLFTSPPPPGILWYARLALLFAAHGALWTSLGVFTVDRAAPCVRAISRTPPLPSADLSSFSALADRNRAVQALRADSRYEEIDVGGGAGLTTAGPMRGNGLVQFRRVWVDGADASTVSVVGLGRRLCGFPGTVHGGVIATMMDEALGQSAIRVLPARTAFTARLCITYKLPTIAQPPAEQSPSPEGFVVIKAWIVDRTGSKATVKGRLEDCRGRTLVEADAVYVALTERGATEGM